MTARAGVLVLLVGLALAGCGVPTDTQPRAIDTVPYDLLSPAPTASTDTPAPARVPPFVYFVEDDRLVRVETTEPTGDVVERTSQVLGVLSQGPGERERAAGLETALGQGTRLTVTGVEKGVAHIDVAVGDREPSPGRYPLAVAQIVLSATSVPGVESVLMTRDGTPVELPLPGGVLTKLPVTAGDYESLTQAPTATTSPTATTTGS